MKSVRSMEKKTGSWFVVEDLKPLVTRADRGGSAGGEAAPPETCLKKKKCKDSFYNILVLIVS